MAVLQEYKCPCCGGAIEFNSSLQKMKCPYCDTEFEMETLASYDKLGCRDAMVLQILAFHVYQVRNKYFGHGDVAHNFNAINDYELAYCLMSQ